MSLSNYILLRKFCFLISQCSTTSYSIFCRLLAVTKYTPIFTKLLQFSSLGQWTMNFHRDWPHVSCLISKPFWKNHISLDVFFLLMEVHKFIGRRGTNCNFFIKLKVYIFYNNRKILSKLKRLELHNWEIKNTSFSLYYLLYIINFTIVTTSYTCWLVIYNYAI